jgi:SAM-dependent methyltransferase
MKQNKYDDPEFFGEYSRMLRSVEGLDAAGEWPAFRMLLPELNNKRVLDLGCGFGWHCRHAREQGARSAVGVDISEKMLARARSYPDDSAIEYHCMAIEDINFGEGAFDVVLSSLAFHYVEHFDRVCDKVYRCLPKGGAFVFSVEHPVFTALAMQDWYCDAQGNRLHWPVDNYQAEGIRHTRFLGSDVVKYHRTFATYINTLLETGFRIQRVSEPQPGEETLRRYPDMKDEVRRPIFLLVSAVRE